MNDCCGRGPAERLDHANARVFHLARFSPDPQLGCRFDSLVHAGSASREAAGFESAHRRAGQVRGPGDAAVCGHLPAVTANRESAGFQRERGEDAERVVVFEEVYLVEGDARLFDGATRGEVGRFEEERILAVVERKRVGGGGGRGDSHERMRPIGREQVAASQNEGGRAVRVGRGVEHVEGRSEEFGLLVRFQLDGLAEHGMFVACSVFVSGEGKAREPIGGDVVFVHVTSHEHGGLRGGGETLHRLVVAVGGSGEGFLHARADLIGHLLNADDECHIHESAFDGEIALTKRRATRRARGFHGDGFDASETRKVREQRAEVRLAREVGREHVAHVHGLRFQSARVFERGFDGEKREFTETNVPVFANVGLAEACEDDVGHVLFLFNPFLTETIGQLEFVSANSWYSELCNEFERW